MCMTRTAAVIAMLAASIAGAATEVFPPVAEVMAQLRRIEAAAYRGAVDPLRLEFQAQARQRPGDTMPRVLVAWCTLPSDDAWNQLKGIATIYPDHPWVRYGMGRIYTTWRGMTDLARAEFEAVLKKQPRFFPAIVGLGDVARVKGDHEAAVARYREALAIADDPFARAGLGLSLAALGRSAEALAELKKATAAHPEQPAALAALVKLSIEAKEPALEAAQVLADLRPKDREARRLIADLRFDAGEKLIAAREYERLVRLGGAERPVLGRLAALYRELGDTEGEERTLHTLAASEPERTEANLRLAQLKYARKDYEGAEGQWLEALERNPSQVEALEGLAASRLEQGAPHEALEHWRAALAVAPERADLSEKVRKLEADFRLPARRAKGTVNNVYFAVQASLGKLYEERRAAKPDLAGSLRLRVRIAADGKVSGVDVLADTVGDSTLLGHAYFGLRDAEYPKAKVEPVFEFVLGGKNGKKGK
jgi:tetratricopeptide (TPR) repeat protein